MEKLKYKALTFDDVLLLPKYSDFLPSEASIESKLTSIDPILIPGRTKLWMYNTKQGKLTYYV